MLHPQTAAGLIAGLCLGWPLLAAASRVATGLLPTKRNYLGDSVTTSGGVLLAPGIAAAPAFPGPLEAPTALLFLGFLLLGLLDDRLGRPEYRGLRGHLRSIREGRPGTGVLKAAGGLVGAAAVLALTGSPGEVVSGTLVVCLTANLVNLLDLRPLRALKGYWLLSLCSLGAGSSVQGALLGVSVAYSLDEGRRRVMLGDAGANALGAVVGFQICALLTVWQESLVVALLALFHLWTERNSVSRWIEQRAWAVRLDRWGVSDA